ncbi:Mitochondrial ornithine transporter 1 [Frankliniella fusca]|uniref:Mitochondrial ornithine transporter 1 n=1 Tax=Frankliniella fusca TaxID=407009 RepID=A0AAE1GTB7_9NEOP|nr:Mitochondrial ornithine transporter 1 [Frankliniella fusca]
MVHKGDSRSSIKDGIIDFTAGSLGGVALVYVGQPLDTIKVKMQTFPNLYKNMFDCIKQTVGKEGFVRGLYAGTVPAIVANVAENSVLFAGYGLCQKVVANVTAVQKVEDLSAVSNATAGCMAAFFSSFTLCPTELIKCKLQAARETSMASGGSMEKVGPLRLTKQVLAESGVRGLFVGLGSTIAREMPGYFVFFGGYEWAREMFTKPGEAKENIGPLATMAAGGVGGMSFWLVTFPADVVKSRIQVSNLTGNLYTVGLDIFKKEGVGALYNGLRPTLLRTFPATATLFLTYEYSKKIMHELFDSDSSDLVNPI